MRPTPATRDFAIGLLGDYRLSREELAQEVDALAQVIQDAVEAQLESLEHRRIA